MPRLYFKVLLMFSMLSSIPLLAQPPKGVKPFFIKCGKTSVRISPAKSWTPDIIKYNNHIMAQQNGFSGLVADIKGGNLFIGSGHSEGGREEVLSYKLLIDGKAAAIPYDGRTIECSQAETIKESYLDDLKLKSKVIISADSIREIHDLSAEKAMKVGRLYGFLHCWTNKSTKWISKQRNGKIKQGNFVNSGGFHLLGDVQWAAEFVPHANAVIFTEFPASLPAGEGRKHCYWDIKNYHKQYYQAMSKKKLRKGDEFHYEMTSKFFSANKENWKKILLSKSKKSGFSFIDFGKAANMALKDEKANNKKGGWFDQGPNNDLGKLPDGIQNFNGVDYNISQSAKSAVILRGHTLGFLPLDSGPIEIKRKAKLIYFLTACGWNTSIDNKVAFITVRYKQGGLYLDIPVRFKKETAGWWKPENIPNADIAWRGQNGSAKVGVYSFGWINPYPEQEIDSITFVSTNSSAVPAFIAATIVDDKTIADKLKADLQAKIQKMKSQNKNSGSAVLKVDFSAKGIPVSDDAASLSVGFGISPDYLIASQGLVKAGKGKPFFRLQIGLANPSPAEGVWDFKRLDQYIDYIYATGGKPMLCFGPTGPVWMATPVSGISMRRNWRPQNLEEYAKYCETIVRRYNIERKTPIKWWQIGNETELKGWSYKYYVKVYKFIAPRLKKIDPTIVIGGPVNCSPNIGWAGELLREAGPMVDFLSYHQYGYSEPFDSPSNYVMKKTPNYMTAVTRYCEQTLKLAKNRNLPVIVTEANTNPRYQRPAGTDPRIRTMFNAAWYTSALSQFVLGGGRSMCYFTIDGGFGACHYRRKGFTLFPVYHAIWLFRKLAHGRITAVKSSSPMVEAYAFQDGKSKRLIVINKMATPVKVELEFNSSPGKGQIFVLNSANAKACSLLDNKKKIRFLTPQKADWNNKKTTLNMEAYEVIGWKAE